MKLPQVLADRASSGRRAAPRDFGGGEGMAAMGQAVSGIGDIAGKLFEEEMSAQVSGSLGEATRKLNDLSMEVQAQPDHNARNKMYADGASKIASEFRKGLHYPRFQGMFDERLEGTLERGRVGIKQGVEKAQIDSAKANRLLFIESKTDALENISDPTARVQAMNEIREEFDAGVRGGLWNAGQAAAMQIKLEDRIAAHELITESQATAGELRDLHPADQIAAVQALPPGKLRAQVDALVHHQIEVDRSLKTAANEKSTDALFFQVEAGVWDDGKPATPESVLERAQLEGLGMDATKALLARLPSVAEPTAESKKAEFTANSMRLRKTIEDKAMRAETQDEFFHLDFYVRRPIFDTSSETGEQAVDFNGQPMFEPSIADLLTTTDLKHLNKMKNDGPTGKLLVGKPQMIEARDNYLMSFNEKWVRKEGELWDLDTTQRAERDMAVQRWDEAVIHEAESATGEVRNWLYPQELRDITRKLLTPQVLNTGNTTWFGSEVALPPWQLTTKGLDDELGKWEEIENYDLAAATAEVAQMADADVSEIRKRDLSAAGKDPIGDGNDLESLRNILLIRRNDLNQMTKGIFR